MKKSSLAVAALLTALTAIPMASVAYADDNNNSSSASQPAPCNGCNGECKGNTSCGGCSGS